MAQFNNNKKEVKDPPKDLSLQDRKLSQQESLEYASYESQHNRREGILDLAHISALKILKVIVWLFIIAIIIIAYHLMAPTKWHWLSEGQLETLHTIFSSVLVSILARNYLHSYFRK